MLLAFQTFVSLFLSFAKKYSSDAFLINAITRPEAETAASEAAIVDTDYLDYNIDYVADISDFIKPKDPMNALNCTSFVCLLTKFDLMKTEQGYAVVHLELPRHLKASSCDSFSCWISNFNAFQSVHGWNLILKEAEEQHPKSQLQQELYELIDKNVPNQPGLAENIWSNSSEVQVIETPNSYELELSDQTSRNNPESSPQDLHVLNPTSNSNG